MEDQEEFEEIV